MSNLSIERTNHFVRLEEIPFLSNYALQTLETLSTNLGGKRFETPRETLKIVILQESRSFPYQVT